jgi:hypothetical protein
MIPRRAQGFAGDVSGSLGQFVEGSLEVVTLPSLAPCFLAVETLPVPVVGF